MAGYRILSVGQCGYDHSRISHTIEARFQAAVVPATGITEALDRLKGESFDLVLVNRVGDRDRRPGLDLIRQMQADDGLAEVPVMLVSDLPDAQDEAVKQGARPGFGKSSLDDERTLGRIEAALQKVDQAG